MVCCNALLNPSAAAMYWYTVSVRASCTKSRRDVLPRLLESFVVEHALALRFDSARTVLAASFPLPAVPFKAVELSRVKDEKSLDFFFREVEVMRVR